MILKDGSQNQPQSSGARENRDDWPDLPVPVGGVRVRVFAAQGEAATHA
jgi:hypothetical protein